MQFFAERVENEAFSKFLRDQFRHFKTIGAEPHAGASVLVAMTAWNGMGRDLNVPPQSTVDFAQITAFLDEHSEKTQGIVYAAFTRTTN